MQMHNLKKNKHNRKAKQVGRGGTRGKTSGRGAKGQNARAGRKKRPEMRDVIKRFPKLRGRGKNFLKSIQPAPILITTAMLDTHFASGENVNPKTLLDKGLLKRSSKFKIVANDAVNKKLIVSNCKISKNARTMIEKAGGKVE